jgi:hypothetical protein
MASRRRKGRHGQRLHDDIGQRLSLLSIKIDSRPKDPSALNHLIGEIQKDIFVLCSDIHELSHQLHPSKLCLRPNRRPQFGPGIKSLFNHKIQDLQVLDQTFEPRHPINLAKAGEFTGQNYFGKPFGSARSSGVRSRATLRHGWRYTVQCLYCSRTFKRMRRDATMKPHKEGYGNNCFGRRGMIVSQKLV